MAGFDFEKRYTEVAPRQRASSCREKEQKSAGKSGLGGKWQIPFSPNRSLLRTRPFVGEAESTDPKTSRGKDSASCLRCAEYSRSSANAPRCGNRPPRCADHSFATAFRQRRFRRAPLTAVSQGTREVAPRNGDARKMLSALAAVCCFRTMISGNSDPLSSPVVEAARSRTLDLLGLFRMYALAQLAYKMYATCTSPANVS